MPHTDWAERYVADPETHVPASVAPALVSTTTTLADFPVEHAKTLIAGLNIHAFYSTNLSNTTNNDVTFIARTPGSTGTGDAVSYVDPGANNAALSCRVAKFLTMAQGSNKDLAFIAKPGITDATVTYQVGIAGAPLLITVTGHDIVIQAKTTDPGLAADSTASEILAALLASSAALAVLTPSLALGSSGAGKPSVFTVVSLAGNCVVVSLATGVAGAITTIGSDVVSLVNADPVASLILIASNKVGNDGTGLVAALSATPLIDAPGSNPTLDVKLQVSPDGVAAYYDAAPVFAQVVAIAGSGAVKGIPVPSNGNGRAKWVLTVGGSGSPIFAYSIPVTFRIL